MWLEINRLLRECLDLVMVENFILQSIKPEMTPLNYAVYFENVV